MRHVVSEMITRGVARSERECSTRWFGRAPNYLADRGDNVSAEAALVLYTRLRAAGHADLAMSVWGEIVRGLRRRDAA